MAIVNSRPLSAECLEAADSPLSLAPNNILTMKSDTVLPPPGIFEEADQYVRKRWRRVQRLADEFWKLWRRSYLASLQTRRIWHKPQDNVTVGDVVVLCDEQECRALWRMARVTAAEPDKDGLVRTVKLKVASPPSNDPQGLRTVTLERPVQKVIVLLKAQDVQK